jgi:undecaprenyl phosphate-alpha-L-ara4N flippase subunit ArnE
LFILSVVLFAGGVFFWLYALARIDLSLAYPTVSSSYIVIAVASLLLFNEKIPPTRWVGMGIIIVGIIVMYRK